METTHFIITQKLWDELKRGCLNKGAVAIFRKSRMNALCGIPLLTAKPMGSLVTTEGKNLDSFVAPTKPCMAAVILGRKIL